MTERGSTCSIHPSNQSSLPSEEKTSGSKYHRNIQGFGGKIVIVNVYRVFYRKVAEVSQ